MSKPLSIAESSDFQYLLELMPVLCNKDEYHWLPELFSIIGHEKLALLCKYAGGETITVPTLDELNDSLEALDWYYKAYVEKSMLAVQIPFKYKSTVSKIKAAIDVRNS